MMPVPSEISDLVQRLNRELDQLETEATEGLALARNILARFVDNFTVTQMFAFLNTAIFFVGTSRSKVQAILESFSTENAATEEEIREVGEDLASDLGRILETKITVSRIKTRLEELR
jgi:hypothetical protein